MAHRLSQAWKCNVELVSLRKDINSAIIVFKFPEIGSEDASHEEVKRTEDTDGHGGSQ